MSFTPSHFQRLFAYMGFAAVSSLATLILLELLCWMTWDVYHWRQPDYYQWAQTSPAYAGEAWLPEFYREERSWDGSKGAYVPFRLWGIQSWHGKYINNDAGEMGIWRRTVNPSGADCANGRRTSVWVFGGSTVFGTAVPDWATLPSYLSRILNRDGHGCPVVTNFGVEGYVTTQELILLTEKLKAGYRPSVVIFYDGFNDAYAGMHGADPRLAHYGEDLMKARVEGTFAGRFDFVQRLHLILVARAIAARLRRPPTLPVDFGDAKATATVDNYEANLKVVSALSHACNFTFFSFLQPVLIYGHKPMVPFEQKLAQSDGGMGIDARPIVKVYQEAERRGSSASFVDLAGLFDSVSEPLYVDTAHLGPRGNELVANAVAKYVEAHPDGSILQPAKRP